jgi:glycosyltransferase involved in cell wall biosynthesis
MNEVPEIFFSENQPALSMSVGVSRNFCPPSVTAVMVTGMHPVRYILARVAIQCFKNQTHSNKNLLIINHGEESLKSDDDRILEIRIKKKPTDTVGDLRNIGLEHASGDFIINWDDDDWYHPRRIEVQLAAQQGDSAVLLKRRLHYSFENGCARYSVRPKGAEATVLHPRDTKFRYPSLVRRSDSVFVRYFDRRIALDNNPCLYIRFYHGLNLWDARHIMRDLADPNLRNVLRIRANHRRFL